MNIHYVPKHHLRRFTDEDDHIVAYKFDSREEISPVSLDDICAEENLWSETIEEALNDAETSFAKVNNKIEDEGTLEVLTEDDYFTLLSFALFQRLRTKSQKEAIDDHVQKTFEWVVEAGYEAGEIPEFAYESVKNGDVRVDHPMFEQLLLQAPLSVSMVWDLNPVLIQNNTEKKFIIGENPAIFDNFYFKYVKRIGVNGLASKGLIISLPMGKDQYLLFYDPQTYYIDSEDPLKVEIGDEQIVRSLNIYQMVWSENFVFYGEEGRETEMRSSHKVFKDFMSDLASTNKYQNMRNNNELIELHQKRPEVTPHLPFLQEKEDIKYELERIDGMREENHKQSREFLKKDLGLDEDELKEVLPERDHIKEKEDSSGEESKKQDLT